MPADAYSFFRLFLYAAICIAFAHVLFLNLIQLYT